MTYTCSVCDESYTETIPIGEHNFVNNTCIYCNTTVAPAEEENKWDYSLDDDNDIITLNFYNNTSSELTDVTVYSHYNVNGKIYKTHLKSNTEGANTKYMFAGCKNINTITFSDELDASSTTDMSFMFYACSKPTEIDFGDNFDTSNVVNMKGMFEYCNKLVNINFGNGFNTGNVINMNSMFFSCAGLTNLDVSNFDTSKVTNMQGMFQNCTSIRKLDLSTLDTGKVTDMSYTFSYMTNLETIDLGELETNDVTVMDHMFSNCSSLKTVDLSSFDTRNVTNIGFMFEKCNALTDVDLSSFNTEKVTAFWNLFDGCSSLKTIDLTSFNTKNATTMVYMFRNCSSLGTINVTEGWWSPCTNITGMFTGCKVSKVTSHPVTTTASVQSNTSGLVAAAMADEMTEFPSDSDTTVSYGIGDKVPFALEAVLPESISAYEKYSIIFNDEMSDGLKLNKNSISVYVGDTKVTSGYKVNVDGQKLTVTIDDVKVEPFSAAAGDVITVKYNAVLTDDAAFENVNEAYLEYSNDPKTDSMGKTVSDEVTAFTFTLQFNKVDGDGDALEGAGFTLYKKGADGEYAAVKDEVNGVTAFSFKGLAAGEYKLVESTTPDGYNTMEDLIFEIKAAAEENADGVASVTNLKMVGTDGAEIDNWNEDTATGVISSNIVNYTGATLPSTGGIGTVIFYVAGGMLVLIAGIVAVAKKKAEDEE